MCKRWVSLICLIIGASALWIYGKYAGVIAMSVDEKEAERIGSVIGAAEQKEVGEEISYEVSMSQYTLSTGYTMEIFQVGGMVDKALENKVNESLNSKLYMLEGPWFSPENISEDKPIIHYRTDRYLSVEHSVVGGSRKRNPMDIGNINNMALQHIKDILYGPGEFEVVESNGRTFLEKMLADGRGIRLNMNGTFKGFIDQIREAIDLIRQ